MDAEKETRKAVERAGLSSFLNDKGDGIKDSIAEAADDVGSQKGTAAIAKSFINNCMKVAAYSEETQRGLGTGDQEKPSEFIKEQQMKHFGKTLDPQSNTAPTRNTAAARRAHIRRMKKKYPGLVT